MLRKITWVAVVLGLASAVGCADGGGSTDDLAFASLCTGTEAECAGASAITIARDARLSNADLLSWDELITLSTLDGHRAGDRYVLDGAPPGLEDRVNDLLDHAQLSNAAYRRGALPYSHDDGSLGRTIHAAEWNIERGQELDSILATFRAANDPVAREQFLSDRAIEHPARARDAVQDDPEAMRTIRGQLDALAANDVLVLNEVDRDMKRSGYRNVVAEIASTLDMNYAWAPEFIEIDPIAVGTERFERQDFMNGDAHGRPINDGSISNEALDGRAAEMNAQVRVDPLRSHNLHGNAVLSRYPIVSARAVPLHTVCWDWNAQEKLGRDFLGNLQATVAERVFLEKVGREIRHGGRTALVVELDVPGVSPDGTTLQYVDGVRSHVVTVVAVHLEARATAECRERQMREVLALPGVRDAGNPVILAGDLNTTGGDGQPMSVERLLMARFGNWQWVAGQVASHFIPYAGMALTIAHAFNWVRLYHDPTGISGIL